MRRLLPRLRRKKEPKKPSSRIAEGRGTIIGLGGLRRSTNSKNGINRNRRRLFSRFKPRLKFNLPGRKKEKRKSMRLPRILIFLSIGIVIVLVVVLVVINSDIFAVRSIEVSGSEDKEIFSEFENKQLFAFGIGDVEAVARESIPNLSEVYVRKLLPDKLLIEVVIDQPKVVAIDSTGSVLLNEDFEVIRELSTEILEFNELELDLTSRTVGRNDSRIVEIYLDDLTQEEKEETSWSGIPAKEKDEFIDTLREEAEAKIQRYFDNQLNIVKNSGADAPVIEFRESIDSTYKLDQLELSLDVVDELEERELVAQNIVWRSVLTFEISLEGNIVLIFSSERELDDQLIDLDTLISNAKLGKDKQVDLRTSNFTVREL